MTNLTNNLVHLSNEPFQKPKNIELKKLRNNFFSVSLIQDEIKLLNKKRGDKSKGEWLRLAFLDKIPVAVPPINIEAWKSLSEISQKLNKLLIHLESKSTGGQLTKTEIFAVKRQISELRSCLTASSTSVR